jgi:predicted membrane protein
MSLNFSYLWFSFIAILVVILVLIIFLVKNENHQPKYIIGYGLFIIGIAIFSNNPLYNLLYFLLLIISLAYFLFFVLRLKIIGKKEENSLFKEVNEGNENGGFNNSNLNTKNLGDS